LALNAGATYSGTAVDYAKFAVFGVPKSGVSLPQLEAAIDGILVELIAQGVSSDELDRAKTRLIADAVYAEDNQASLARWYGSALATGQMVEDVRGWPDRIRAVTAEAVQNAARTWLDRRHSATGYLVKTLQPEEKRS
jgi:zinc protease